MLWKIGADQVFSKRLSLQKNILKGAIIHTTGVFMLVLSVACGNTSSELLTKEKTVDTISLNRSNAANRPVDTTLSINGRAVSIKYPDTISCGTILCLPGWNFSRTDVCERSSFCKEALRRGFVPPR